MQKEEKEEIFGRICLAWSTNEGSIATLDDGRKRGEGRNADIDPD